jgi:F0F1-type ATP synthase membrane subunit b/b'
MAAGKILDANLDTAKQRQLVDAAIKDLNKRS